MKQFAFIVISVALALYLYHVPVDLYVANLFFKTDRGFIHNIYLSSLHDFVYGLMVITCLLVCINIAYQFYSTKSTNYREYIKLIYLISCFIIGPGLVVNLGLKEHSHRPRPSQTDIFTGNYPYKAPFNFTGMCPNNCSFVSGHASVGFMFFAFAFIESQRKKRYLVNLGAAALGSTFGLGRMMQGSHYLSDIIFSGIVVYLVCYLLAQLLDPLNEHNPS